jgi:phage terminase small subunit
MDRVETWHKGLTERQRKFVETYSSNGGNALQSATVAGYAKPQKISFRLLENVGIQQAIETLRQSETSTAIATRRERQEIWTSIIRDVDLPVMARLRASELLGKSQGDFIDRVEVKSIYEEMPDDVRRARISFLLSKI